MKHFLEKLQKNHDFWFLLITSVVFFLFRLPSLFEPYWYGDEGIYEVLGFAIRHGRLLYRDIWDNKPPVLYLYYALFDGNQFWVRLLSLLFGLGAVIAFFYLAKRLFTSRNVVYVCTALFAFLFATPLLAGNIANAENFMLFPIILAAVFMLHALNIKKNMHTTYYLLLITGLLLGISFLTKVVGVFDAFAFGLFIIIFQCKEQKNLQLAVKNSVSLLIPLIAGFLVPIIITIGFFVANHALSVFINSTLKGNVSYVNYGNQFIIPQGLLVLKSILLLACCGLLFYFRKKLSATQIFIFLWFVFSIYNWLFAGRPYDHYMLVVIASFSLLAGWILILLKPRNTIMLGVIFLLLLIVTKNFPFQDRITNYYANFTQYLLGIKNTNDYQSFFDRISPRDYALAAYVRTHAKPEDTLFVWGNSAQIYYMAGKLPVGRFVVAYHVTTNAQTEQETNLALVKNPPTFIIILPNQSQIPYSLKNYQEQFILQDAILYEKVF